MQTTDGEYLVVFHCRVRPGAFTKHTSKHGHSASDYDGNPIWLVRRPADIKPIAMLLACGTR